MANETRPLLVYTHRKQSWEPRRPGFHPLDDMPYSMRKKRIHLRGANWSLLTALAWAIFALPAARAQPQGFTHAGQTAPASPAENAAYSAAISQSDPQARASAIQQFLIQYPNSTLRQPAIAQMMLAKRDVHGPNAGPPHPPQPPTRSMPTATSPPPTAAVAPSNAPVVTPQPASSPLDSLLQHPAKPAEVTVTSGSLAIKADNSSLSQILQQISRSTGMKVDGLGQDERIFGNYGPGDPREVLLSLLDGLGYNVLMVGNEKGTPRQLTLSHRSAGGAVASAAPTRNNHEQEEDEIEQEQPQIQPEQQQPVTQTPPGNPDGAPQPPRNPAEIQQELLRLRQQQQQQTPPQPPQ